RHEVACGSPCKGELVGGVAAQVSARDADDTLLDADIYSLDVPHVQDNPCNDLTLVVRRDRFVAVAGPSGGHVLRIDLDAVAPCGGQADGSVTLGVHELLPSV